jgi:hypothetical protein
VPVPWNHNRDGLAGCLFGGVAKDALGTPIPTCDYAIEVLANNCVVTGLDNSGKRAQTLFAFLKGI